MIIDARNLNITNSASRPVLPVMNKKEAGEIIRVLNRTGDRYFGDMQPLDSENANESAAVSSVHGTDSIDVSNIKEVKWEFAFETEYSKDKALNNAWVASQNSIFKLMGSSAKVEGTAAVGMDKGEFLDYVRENGLEKQIIWTDIERNLVGPKTYDNFREFTDYTAALFAGLENRINSDFSGDERKEQLDIMNGLYEKALKEFSDTIMHGTNGETNKGLDGSFKTLGVEYSEEKLDASIRGAIDGKKAAYAEFIKKNKDYAGVENTKDSWLKRDVGFMTCALKNVYKPENVKAYGDLWNENEIVAIGALGKMYGYDPVIEKTYAKFDSRDEESIGLAMSMCWLATEKITKDLNAGDRVKELADSLFNKYWKAAVDNINEALEGARKIVSKNSSFADLTDPSYEPLNPSSFAALDEKAIHAVLNVTKRTYQESGDYKKAIYAAASFARDTALSKVKNNDFSKVWRFSTTKRSQDSNRFWSSFYDTDSKVSYGGGMSKLIKKWNYLEDIMASKNMQAFDRKISAHMYTVS